MSNSPWRLPEEIEKPFRHALATAGKGNAVEVRELLHQMTDEQIAACIRMSGWATAYAAISAVSRRWPTDHGLRVLAQKVVEGGNRDEAHGVTEANVYKYVSEVALQCKPYEDVFEGVFEDPGDLLIAPLFFAVNVLATFHPEDKTIWEFLDQIETAFEAAYLVDLNVLPALMVRARMPQPEQTPGAGR